MSFLSGTLKSLGARRELRRHAVRAALDRHGELIFDLCASVLRDAEDAEHAFRRILRRTGRAPGAGAFVEFERALALKVACEHLRAIRHRHPVRMSAPEQLALDAAPDAPTRLEKLEGYLRKLPLDDQLVLLLRDKHRIPFPEISAALGLPEGSLKVRRQQALRGLEDWIWGASR